MAFWVRGYYCCDYYSFRGKLLLLVLFVYFLTVTALSFGHHHQTKHCHHHQKQQDPPSSCESYLSDNESSSSSCCFVRTDDISIIRKGGIYVHPNWIPTNEVTLLRNDIINLRNEGCYFQRSGLSNRVDGDTNTFDRKDRLTCTITENLKNSNIRKSIEHKLEQLRMQLSTTLYIPQLTLEEHYYSISPPGSFLPRHMDERHEETKGSDKAWEATTRRSISWLLYLNEPTYNNDHGGQLRTHCRLSTSICGSHDGNLQVGWLPASSLPSSSSCINTKETGGDNDDDTHQSFDPVFLDSWIQTPTSTSSEEEQNRNEEQHLPLKWRPLSALYRIKKDDDNVDNDNKYKREYITQPFGPDTPSWPSNINLEPEQFVSALAKQVELFMDDQDNKNSSNVSLSSTPSLIGVESVSENVVTAVDIIPSGGTLVLFDSVTIPHEVMEILSTDMTAGREAGKDIDSKGGLNSRSKSLERYAMAGWFHEPVQEFPDWYGT